MGRTAPSPLPRLLLLLLLCLSFLDLCCAMMGKEPPPFPLASDLVAHAWKHPVPAWRIQPGELAPPIDNYHRFAPGGLSAWGDGKHPSNSNRCVCLCGVCVASAG